MLKKIATWLLHKWVWFLLILIGLVAACLIRNYGKEINPYFTSKNEAEKLVAAIGGSLPSFEKELTALVRSSNLDVEEARVASKRQQLISPDNKQLLELQEAKTEIQTSVATYLDQKLLDERIKLVKWRLEIYAWMQKGSERRADLLGKRNQLANQYRDTLGFEQGTMPAQVVSKIAGSLKTVSFGAIQLPDSDTLYGQIEQIDNELRKQDSLGPPPYSANIVLRNIEADRISAEKKLKEDWIYENLWKPAQELAPIALACVVIGVIASNLIRFVCFFVLAPIAVRQSPILLVAGTEKPKDQMTIGSDSVVALPIQLMPGQALLAHHDYVKTVPSECKTSTQFLVSALMPFTSLAAGLYNLVRVEPDKTETVVLSSGHDGLNELVQIDLPSNVSLAVEPRNLVGFVVDQNGGVKLRRKWVLLKMQSWLKLQFRHILVEGPVKLIMKGGRGAVVTPVQDELLISPEYVLAFSANLGYGTFRTETFGGYFSRKKSLLKDRFTGKSGFVVHQEATSESSSKLAKKSGLEGLMDGVLKAFGI